jgi:hypothetical protein
LVGLWHVNLFDDPRLAVPFDRAGAHELKLARDPVEAIGIESLCSPQ